LWTAGALACALKIYFFDLPAAAFFAAFNGLFS
jgi:hypothetical protein